MIDGTDQLRTIRIERGFPSAAPGSVLISAGDTVVLCTASVADEVPPWREELGAGWVTAEYAMLPGSTSPRKRRERDKVDSRSIEIQRLIGRSLRAVVDFQALGPRTVTVDCDVVKADGGTRTLAITGGFVALVDALRSLPEFAEGRLPLVDSVAAISVGIVGGEFVLDLDYAADSNAQVDMNVVMTGGGRFVEIQGTAEQMPFDDAQLDALLKAAREGIRRLTALQREALGDAWPFD
ncbi:MAG: ribonuclease PH [Planctomycetota bacterium]|nr:MAG: ribonuclease PH [Planctomycetota bacterium]